MGETGKSGETKRSIGYMESIKFIKLYTHTKIKERGDTIFEVFTWIKPKQTNDKTGVTNLLLDLFHYL